MAYFTGKSLGLETMRVDIEDTSYLSSYFNITDFNPIFGAGKNLLVINTTSLLSSNPNIQVEARDSNNNYLYLEAAVVLDKVSNRQKYYFSLHVYDNLSSGPGKITIIGKTIDNKTVRWSANIVVSPNSENNSKVVFYNKPKLEVFPIINYSLSGSVEIYPKIITGSFYSIAVNPPKDFDLKNNYNRNKLDYRIVNSDGQFVDGLENFPITLNINSIKPFGTTIPQSITESIALPVYKILNRNTLLVSEPYEYNNKIVEIVAGTYTCSFNSVKYDSAYFFTQSYATEPIDFNGGTRLKKYSYAFINYSDLQTFSGKATRHKVYKKNLSTAGDFELITDEAFSPYELLKDVTTPNKSFEKLGNFYTQFHINNFWFTSSANFNLYYDNDIFLNAMRISGSGINNGYTIVKCNSTSTNSDRNANYIPYDDNQNKNFLGSAFDSNFLHFYPDSSYKLSYNLAFLEKSLGDTANISFYISSSSPNIANEIGYENGKGIKIGEVAFSGGNTSKIYDSLQTVEFKLLNSTYGTLVIYGKNFTSAVVGNISITPTDISGFSQDVYSIKVPFDVVKANDIFEIKSELYDKDGNFAFDELDTVQYFDFNGVTVPFIIDKVSDLTVDNLHVNYKLTVTGPSDLYGNVYARGNLTASAISASSITSSLYGTASYALSSSRAVSSSYAVSSSQAITASYSLTTAGSVINAITASYLNYTGGNTGTASYAITASYSLNSGLSSQWTNISGGGIYYNSGNVGIGTTNPKNKLEVVGNISCSIITASLINLQNSVLFDYSASNANNITTIIKNETGSYNAAFFDYIILSASNLRAGTVFSCFSSSNISYTEYSTTDIGDTSQVTMSVSLSDKFINLVSDTPSGQTWQIKAFGRYL